MEGWADLDEGQGGLGICSLATVPKSTQSMGSSNPPPRLPPATATIISAGQSPVPTSQVFSQFCGHAPPPAIPPDSHVPNTMLGFLTVHSGCASASPHLTPCFPQPLLSSYPSLAPSTRLPLSHISGRPSLAPASALLFLSSPLVYSPPSAVGSPKTPLSVVSAFSLFSPAFLS